MATTIQSIVEQFTSRIRDYNWMDYYPSELDQITESYLKSSIASFKRLCKSDLTVQNDEIAGDLTDEEIGILVNGMILEWLKPFIYNSDNLRNGMNTKDYSEFSPANLLKEMSAVYTSLKQEHDSDIVKYSYFYGDVGTLPSIHSS